MENLKPIENNKISFVRLFADLQVCSVYRYLKKLLPSEKKHRSKDPKNAKTLQPSLCTRMKVAAFSYKQETY